VVAVDEVAAYQLLEPLTRIVTVLDGINAAATPSGCESERVLVETSHPYQVPTLQAWDLTFAG
jgi:hypothetical protein